MPFNDELDSPDFRAWLTKTIEPLCDADPAVLSDYIIALLKHDASMEEAEWKEFITKELIDFLEASSAPFVDTLFTALSTKAYNAAVPTPVPAPVATHPIPTGPAADIPQYHPQFPAAGPSSGAPAVEDVSMQDATAGVGKSGRPKCRDYHERGYCMRGANCQFEHSEDVLIPTPDMMFQGFFPPFMGMPPGFPGMPGMPPGLPQRGRGGPRGRGGHPGRGGYPPHGHGHGQRPEPDENFLGNREPPKDRNGNTLVVSDIPRQNLTVPSIKDYFSKFGEVTNVAIDAKSARALVSFTSNFEAYQAWKSDQAIFDNRHVKVLWHRPHPGQGAAGQKALEASRTLLENMKKIEAGEGGQKVPPKFSGPEQRLQAALAELEHRERQTKKEPLMAEQKILLARASKSTKEEKLTILKRLKAIAKEIEVLNNPPPKPEGMEIDETKAKLDQELAAHGMEQGSDEELVRLSSQLASLKEKANTYGISPRYSPYAPRGRGRGRGRGGRSVHTLDNRSRTIVVSGDNFADEGARKVAVDWYESTGGAVEVVEGSLRISYPQREMAEKALALGTDQIREQTGIIRTAWEAPQAPDVESYYQPVDVEMGAGASMGETGEEERRGERNDDD
ncbi:hypothetical protein L198_06849 [Cryptococcus wingfieldii CBS 7118]|uniref:Uncharacterized protein n=1 Tax=Cryptococcus wingfieldii CBS 7118 TaxID=1295528 RepID=A0A1E3IHL8_9TREE|nr:hypothetical protein L198_06849 [Cryptococcus wingfieldii CBS 7118]ODN88089.1 hypothetical protein L198_06849 [Cryptococcus wingfieldii CBS 7118]